LCNIYHHPMLIEFQLGDSVAQFFRNMFTDVMLTHVYIILVVLHLWTVKVFDLWLLSLIVLCISSYIVYVSPRLFIVDKFNFKYILHGPYLHAAHVVMHIIPCMFIMYHYLQYYTTNKYSIATANSLLLVFVYFWLYNPVKIYRVHPYALVSMFVLACLLYMII
jgi:hypothetical protein